MAVSPQFPNAWTVKSVVVLPGDKGVQVTFAVAGRDPIRFRTKRFGVGRRGRRTAALAKFADQAGYGDAEELYRHLCTFPRDFQGPLHWGTLPWEEWEQRSQPTVKRFCPAEDAA